MLRDGPGGGNTRGEIDREGLRAALEAIGADSLVLAGGGTRLRVHAHVAAPQALFDRCAEFGTVEAMKADDMLLQSRSAERSRRVAVVVDSAADLPEDLAERFGVLDYPRIFSRSQFITMFGTAGGPLVLGWLHDNAGGYRTSYLVAAGCSLAGACVLAWGGPATFDER